MDALPIVGLGMACLCLGAGWIDAERRRRRTRRLLDRALAELSVADARRVAAEEELAVWLEAHRVARAAPSAAPKRPPPVGLPLPPTTRWSP